MPEDPNEKLYKGAAIERPTKLADGGGYDYARPNPRIFPRAERWEDSWDASVNLSWTLWDGGRRAGAHSGVCRAVGASWSDDGDRRLRPSPGRCD